MVLRTHLFFGGDMTIYESYTHIVSLVTELPKYEHASQSLIGMLPTQFCCSFLLFRSHMTAVVSGEQGSRIGDQNCRQLLHLIGY